MNLVDTFLIKVSQKTLHTHTGITLERKYLPLPEPEGNQSTTEKSYG